MGGRYNTVDEIIEELKKRNEEASRFPIVLINTNNVETWYELVSKLESIVDEVVYLSKYCTDEHNSSDMAILKRHINSLRDKRIMIVPINEEARLTSVEDIILKFRKDEWGSNLKIYLPLLEVSRDTINNIKNVDNPREKMRKIPVYEISQYTTDNDNNVIKIYSLNKKRFNNIEKILQLVSKNGKFMVIRGFKRYLEVWESKKIHHGTNIILYSKFFNSPYTDGIVQIIPLKNLKDIILNIYNTNIPIEYKESEEHFWIECLKKCSEGWDELTTTKFDEINIIKIFEKKLEKWNELSEFEKWLWFNLARYNLANTSKTNNIYDCELCSNPYIVHVLNNCDTYENLESTIWTAILTINKTKLSDNIIQGRGTLIDKIIGINAPPIEFENEINKITNPIYKLRTLYGNNYDNQINIVKCVGECLKNDNPQLYVEISKILKITYPDLYHYMSIPLNDEFIKDYIKTYIIAKLKNELTPELIQLNEKFSKNSMLWKYQSRAELIDNKNADLTCVIDGLGIEWCGLIKSKFESDTKFNTNGYSISIDIGRANLPTTTEFNKFNCSYPPYMELDKYFHSPNYIYPNNIVEEIEKINSILEKIIPKINQYNTIIITADHGSTRFSGYINERIKCPKNSESKRNGRFVQSTEKPEENDEYIVISECKNNKYYAVSKTYKIFEGGKRTNAESHGGATLEESLVPIITISSSQILPNSININVLTPDIPLYKPYLKIKIISKLKMDELDIKPQLKVLNEYILGKKINDTIWEFDLKETSISAGKHIGTIELNIGYKKTITFKILKGLEEEEYF